MKTFFLQHVLLVGLGLGLAGSAFAEQGSWPALNAQIVSLYRQGNYSEAAKVGEEALQVAESTYGPDHPNMAASLNNLAAAYHSQGNYARAEALYKRALAIDEKIFGKDHPNVAADRANLEELYKAMKQPLSAGPSAPGGSLGETPSGRDFKPKDPSWTETSSREWLLSDGGRDGKKFLPDWVETDMELSNGYRIDNLKFNIAGNIGGRNPNILSELIWHDVEIDQVKAKGHLTVLPYFTVRAYADYGWVFQGDNQDSDYLADNRTLLFSESRNTADKGSVSDASIGIGYPIRPPSGRYELQLTPLGGYSYHRQLFTITDGSQTQDPFALFGGLQPIRNLDSEYKTRWRGPWVGFDFSLKALEKVKVFGTFEYHWADYKADAHWNLRTDFAQPKSFLHTTEGNGVIASFGMSYLLSKHWSIFFDADYEDWDTDPGIDRTFFSDGTRVDTRLNRVGWESLAFMVGAKCSI